MNFLFKIFYLKENKTYSLINYNLYIIISAVFNILFYYFKDLLKLFNSLILLNELSLNVLELFHFYLDPFNLRKQIILNKNYIHEFYHSLNNFLIQLFLVLFQVLKCHTKSSNQKFILKVSNIFNTKSHDPLFNLKQNHGLFEFLSVFIKSFKLIKINV